MGADFRTPNPLRSDSRRAGDRRLNILTAIEFRDGRRQKSRARPDGAFGPDEPVVLC